MSSNLMETSPGGEETNQYESSAPDVQPHAKLGGQLGAASTSTTSTTTSGGSGTENKEAIPGGNTNIATGQAGAGDDSGTEDASKARREQGYGGDRDMDRRIGA